MEDSIQPAVPRLLLGMELRRLREATGLSRKEVAEALDWSESKILRVELGRSARVSVTDLRAMLAHYQITDSAVVDELAALTRASRAQTWRTPYRKHLSLEFYTFLDHEATAARIWLYEDTVVPGLLQSHAYTLARSMVVCRDDDARERVVAITRERQRIVAAAARGPEMTFLLDMAVLQREMGDEQVMRDQLQHLGELATYPNITIRIIPFDAGAHPGLYGSSFAGFDFTSNPSVVFLDDRHRDVAIRSKPEDVGNYRRYFDAIAERASPHEATACVLAEALAAL